MRNVFSCSFAFTPIEKIIVPLIFFAPFHTSQSHLQDTRAQLLTQSINNFKKTASINMQLLFFSSLS